MKKSKFKLTLHQHIFNLLKFKILQLKRLVTQQMVESNRETLHNEAIKERCQYDSHIEVNDRGKN
jgi:hypothetical protein